MLFIIVICLFACFLIDFSIFVIIQNCIHIHYLLMIMLPRKEFFYTFVSKIIQNILILDIGAIFVIRESKNELPIDVEHVNTTTTTTTTEKKQKFIYLMFVLLRRLWFVHGLLQEAESKAGQFNSILFLFFFFVETETLTCKITMMTTIGGRAVAWWCWCQRWHCPRINNFSFITIIHYYSIICSRIGHTARKRWNTRYRIVDSLLSRKSYKFAFFCL